MSIVNEVKEELKKKIKFPIILRNALQTPDGTVIESKNRNDYVIYTDKNNKVYMVDGGKDYIRRSCNGDELDRSVIINNPEELETKFEDIREYLLWGTRGKSSKEKLKFKKLKNLSIDHIQAILDTQFHLTDFYKYAFITELQFRQQKLKELDMLQDLSLKITQEKYSLEKLEKYIMEKYSLTLEETPDIIKKTMKFLDKILNKS